MTTLLHVALFVAAWFTLGSAVTVGIGQVIHYRDREESW